MKNIKDYYKQLLLLIVLFSTIHVSTQAQLGTGLLLEDEVYNATPNISMAFGGMMADIPSRVSMRAYCPKVQHQGEIGSCVGWATGYGAFTIMRAKAEGWTDAEQITENAFSALFIYNQVKIGDCYQGSLFSSALNLLKTEGDCLSRDFDEPRDDCHRNPNDNAIQSAQSNPYMITDYFTLFRSSDEGRNKVLQTKTSLAEGKPVVIGMMLRENFKELTKDDEFWNPEAGDIANAGGHAMVVVGYDEEKGGFEVMNSWGAEWGNDGFFWVKFEDFGKFCVYGYQLLIDKKEDPLNPKEPLARKFGKKNRLSAQFVFRYPTDFDANQDRMIYTEATTKFNGKYYELADKAWLSDPRFQLVTRKIIKNRYVYVFSIDPNNEARIHWPRNKKYNKAFEQYNEGAIIPYNNIEIVVPDRDNALVKDQKGEDRLLVLVSMKPINDILERVTEMTTLSGDYMSRLYQTFGDRMIATDQIQYNDNMRFSATVKDVANGAYIVPLMLVVKE